MGGWIRWIGWVGGWMGGWATYDHVEHGGVVVLKPEVRALFDGGCFLLDLPGDLGGWVGGWVGG